MSEQNNPGTRWVFGADDSRAHILADTATGDSGVLVTMCGREYPAHHTPTFSVPPALTICPGCTPFARIDRPAPVFPAPTHY